MTATITHPPLGSPELRVAAAKDVLERIAPELHVDTNAYVQVYEGAPCLVCACGSLFLALASERLLGDTDENDLATHAGLPRLKRPEPLLVKDIVQTVMIGRSDLTDDDIRELLHAAFSQEQLQLIEIAFMQRYEGNWADMRFNIAPPGGHEAYAPSYIYNYWSQDEISTYFSDRAKAHWLTLERARTFSEGVPRQRLVAIMQNIVDNQGEFRP